MARATVGKAVPLPRRLLAVGKKSVATQLRHLPDELLEELATLAITAHRTYLVHLRASAALIRFVATIAATAAFVTFNGSLEERLQLFAYLANQLDIFQSSLVCVREFVCLF